MCKPGDLVNPSNGASFMKKTPEPDALQDLARRVADGSADLSEIQQLHLSYVDHGEYTKAAEVLALVPLLDLQSADQAYASCERGEALDIVGRHGEAESCFREVISLVSPSGDDPTLYYVKGKSLYYLSKLDQVHGDTYAREGIEVLVKFITQYPESPYGYCACSYVAELSLRLGDAIGADKWYQEAHRLAGSDQERAWAALGRAEAAISRGSLDVARDLCARVLEEDRLNENASRAHFYLGKTSFIEGRWQEAAEELEEAQEMRVQDASLNTDEEYLVDLLWHLAVCYYETRHYADAASRAQMILARVSDDHRFYADSLLTIGHCQIALGNRDLGIERYRQVLLCPAATAAQVSMAKKCLFALGAINEM